MSILNCESCSEPIDTDETPEMHRERHQQWLCDECVPDECPACTKRVDRFVRSYRMAKENTVRVRRLWAPQWTTQNPDGTWK